MTAEEIHGLVLNVPSGKPKRLHKRWNMKKKRQSNKDECTRVTLQEVKLHSDRNREAVAAAAILAGGLEGVEGEERNGGAFWELPKSPHTGSQNEEGEKDRGMGAVAFPWRPWLP